MSFKALIKSKGLFVALATEISKAASVIKAITGVVNLGAGGVILSQVVGTAQEVATSGSTGSLEAQIATSLVAVATSVIVSGVHKIVYWLSDFADDGKLNKSVVKV